MVPVSVATNAHSCRQAQAAKLLSHCWTIPSCVPVMLNNSLLWVLVLLLLHPQH